MCERSVTRRTAITLCTSDPDIAYEPQGSGHSILLVSGEGCSGVTGKRLLHPSCLCVKRFRQVFAAYTRQSNRAISRGLGGPTVSFEGYMPRAGRYRSWTQFLRNGQLTTISFTFSVLSLDDAMRSAP